MLATLPSACFVPASCPLPQSLSNVIYSAASMGLRPDYDLLHAVGRAIEWQIADFKPQARESPELLLAAAYVAWRRRWVWSLFTATSSESVHRLPNAVEHAAGGADSGLQVTLARRHWPKRCRASPMCCGPWERWA